MMNILVYMPCLVIMGLPPEIVAILGQSHPLPKILSLVLCRSVDFIVFVLTMTVRGAVVGVHALQPKGC